MINEEIKLVGQRLQNVLNLQESKDRRKWATEHCENIDVLYDRVIALTRNAISMYEKRAKISIGQLAKNIVEKTELTKLGFEKSGLTKRDWNLAGAARSIQNMLYFTDIFIGFENADSVSIKEKTEKMQPIISAWESRYVDFSAAFLLVESASHKKSGDGKANKTRPIKIWALEQARKIREKNPSISKSQIADKIYRDKYDPENWKTPLTQHAEFNTIYGWIRADNTFN
ncbi:MAG: hypothetical protein JW985_01580 [Alphaproteobacteria bacterium]|nr:hypothetical protein [Alphaproteobacteria bacterium]